MNNRTIVTTSLLVSLALAGCVADTNDDLAILDPSQRVALTQPIYDVLGHFDHAFTGTTGDQLYVDYYLPTVPEEQTVPVILVFTPYQEPDQPEVTAGEGSDPITQDKPYRGGLVEYFVPRGYAVAFADVRGNHNAGGCIDQTGPEQWQDGYDYVEWLGTQEWSNGKVGMYGASYDGETQFTTAMMAPPHLATIVPVASVSNQYEWSFYQGVPYELQPFIGMFSYFQGSAVPSTDPDNAVLYPEKLDCQAQQFQAGADFSGDHTTFWKERDYRPMAANITASVLHVHGLADWNVRPVHIDPLFNDIQSEKRGIFGQWGHAYPDRDDWQFILNAWYDYWLLDRQNGILDILPPVLIEDDQEQWWGHEAFPPVEQPWMALELSANGAMVEPGAAEAGELIIHDYQQEVLVDLASQGYGPTPAIGPLPELGPTPGLDPTGTAGTTVTGHPRAVSFEFTTTEELRLVGRPYLTLTATSSQTSTHWVAKLLVEGAPCENSFAPVCQNHGYQDTRHRAGFDEPSDVTPGEPYNLTITMFPQYDVIPAGSKVTLVLTNNDPDIQQDATGSMNTILLGGDNRATLHLPLAPAEVALPHDELPEIYPGYR